MKWKRARCERMPTLSLTLKGQAFDLRPWPLCLLSTNEQVYLIAEPLFLRPSARASALHPFLPGTPTCLSSAAQRRASSPPPDGADRFQGPTGHGRRRGAAIARELSCVCSQWCWCCREGRRVVCQRSCQRSCCRDCPIQAGAAGAARPPQESDTSTVRRAAAPQSSFYFILLCAHAYRPSHSAGGSGTRTARSPGVSTARRATRKARP